MTRLTKKVGENYCSQNGDFYDLYNKLGRLEDLEEQLGFDLEKLQETNHIYANDCENFLRKHEIIGVNFKEKKIWFWVDFCPMYLEFENYKETFWLKEDKSE